ncbi:MAG: hypothetical protein K2K57_05635 [Oscillospiraceae bacterium]|nr:hypothetical protein [Oscillospiraceae bacterium]
MPFNTGFDERQHYKGMLEMIHTYVFKENSTDKDFKIICRKIEKECPGYALSERESIEGRIETVRMTKGETEIRAEFERDNGTVTVCSDEPLPKLDKLSKRWETKGYSIIRKILLFMDILAGSPARVKFILLPLLLFSAAFMGGFAKGGDVYEGIIAGLLDILTALKDLLINWAFFGWAWLIPAGAALNALANRQENPSENKRELSGEKTKGFLRKLWTFIKRKADLPILTGLAALPVLGVCYASCRFSIYGRFCFEASIIKSNPLYAPLAIYMAALPYLIIGETVFSGMKKRKNRPSAKTAALFGACSVMAALAVAVGFSDLYTVFDYIRYEAGHEPYYEAKIYNEARMELIPTEYADELSDIAEYALANNYFDWTECPDESLEKQWEKIFLEGRANYWVRTDENSVVFYILEKGHKITPNAEGDDANEN